MTSDVLAARVEERERLIEIARVFVDQLGRRLPLVAAAVVGSVARGDFNVWSDVDVVIVAEALPERAPDRGRALVQDAAGGVQPVGYTPDEFRAAVRRGNPMAREAITTGVVLAGAEFFRRSARS